MATITTIYPDYDGKAGAATTDGRVYETTVATWATIRAAAGDGASPSASSNEGFFMETTAVTDEFKSLGRYIVLFDASVVPTGDTISSAVISIKSATAPTDTFTTSQEYTVASSNPASNTTLAASDFDIADFGTTEFIDTRKDLSTLTAGAYEDHTLNSAGISNISKGSGVSKFAFMLAGDFDNVNLWEANKGAAANFYQAGTSANTSNDPKIVITHEPLGNNSARRMHMMMM